MGMWKSLLAAKPLNILAVAALVLWAGLLVGCAGSESGTDEPPSPGVSTDHFASNGASETSTVVSNDPLGGTEWRLVEFQSMDDAIGSLSPDDASLYTMRLNVDGTVNMRLNCNRANGSWTAEPDGDGESGRFEFGPLATTQALCPSPSMDEQIAAQADWVRSYLLRDGRLHLSLLADGGIYVWEPHTLHAEVLFETEPDTELEAAIRRASPDYTRELVAIGNQQARYVYSQVDLDEDGTEEVFVYLMGPFFCGTGGCDLLLFTGGEMGYSLVDAFPISRVPVVVSPEKTAGWGNLIRLESGGGVPSSYVTHTFDGRHYVERERNSADSTPEGTRVLAGEVTFERGIPFEPRH